MQTWESNRTCDGCGQHIQSSGYGNGGDIYDGCSYCGWFSEAEETYDMRVNPEPDQALLIRLMNMVSIGERMLRQESERWYDEPLWQLMLDLKQAMRVGHDTVYIIKERFDDTLNVAQWIGTYGTRTEAEEAIRRRDWANEEHGYWTEPSMITVHAIDAPTTKEE
jgi:hypothetical protein